MQTEEYERLYRHEDTYWWFVGRRRLALSLLSQAIESTYPSPAAGGGAILDLGCGTGAVLAEMSGERPAIGIDVSTHALRFCRRRGLTGLLQATAEQVPLATGSVEAVIALDIFEHVRDDLAACREALRVLRPGGTLVLSVPAFRWLWGPHDVALMHHRRYSRREVERLLSQSGFQIERLTYSVFLLFPAVLVVRLLDKLRRGPSKVSLPKVPPWLNRLLIRVQMWEARWTARHRLPWGSSLVAVARKPLAGSPQPATETE